MDTNFEKQTDEGDINLMVQDEHTLLLTINEKGFFIEGYPKKMIDVSYSSLERQREDFMEPFTISHHQGQITHSFGTDIYVLSIEGFEASLEGDELRLLIMIIQNYFCV